MYLNVEFAGVSIPCRRTMRKRHRDDKPELYNLTVAAEYCGFQAYPCIRYLKLEKDYWTQALLDGQGQKVSITNGSVFWVIKSCLIETIFHKCTTNQGKQWKTAILDSIPISDISIITEQRNVRNVKSKKRKAKDFEHEIAEIEKVMVDCDDEVQAYTEANKRGPERKKLGRKTFVDRIEVEDVHIEPNNILSPTNILDKQKKYLVAQHQYLQLCLDVEHAELTLIPKQKLKVLTVHEQLSKMEKDKETKKVLKGDFKSAFQKFETVVNREVRDFEKLKNKLKQNKELKQKLRKERFELLQAYTIQIQQYGEQEGIEEEADYRSRIGLVRYEATCIPNCGTVSYEKLQQLLDVFSEGCFECSQHGDFSRVIAHKIKTRGITLYIEIECSTNSEHQVTDKQMGLKNATHVNEWIGSKILPNRSVLLNKEFVLTCVTAGIYYILYFVYTCVRSDQ